MDSRRRKFEPQAGSCWMADFKHLQYEALQQSSLEQLTDRAKDLFKLLHRHRDGVVFASALAGLGVVSVLPSKEPSAPDAPTRVERNTDAPDAGSGAPPRNAGLSCG